MGKESPNFSERGPLEKSMGELTLSGSAMWFLLMTIKGDSNKKHGHIVIGQRCSILQLLSTVANT